MNNITQNLNAFVKYKKYAHILTLDSTPINYKFWPFEYIKQPKTVFKTKHDVFSKFTIFMFSGVYEHKLCAMKNSEYHHHQQYIYYKGKLLT